MENINFTQKCVDLKIENTNLLNGNFFATVWTF